MQLFYDKNCRQITMDKWGRLIADPKYVTINVQRLNNGLLVSTVWAGIDLAHHSTNDLNMERPLIFETAVFKSWKLETLESVRTATLTDARLCHKFMVRKWTS